MAGVWDEGFDKSRTEVENLSGESWGRKRQMDGSHAEGAALQDLVSWGVGAAGGPLLLPLEKEFLYSDMQLPSPLSNTAPPQLKHPFPAL